VTALVVALVIASVGSYLLKLAGVSLPESVLANPTVQRVAGFLPVAMLTALVVVGLADGDGDGRWSFDWAVLAGVGAAVIALLLRAGVLVVFIVAVTVTALLRLLV
jgi:branched-subunit amino acid transport protein